MSDTQKVTCRTCESSHVKDNEFPCRDCFDNDRWEFAAKDPWHMFPLKPDPWQKIKEKDTP